MSKKSGTGICYLVGAGPGDPGLMTLRGKECIEMADVIVYDYLSNAEFLQWARPGTEKIYAGKKAKDHAIPQGGINQLLIDKAKEGKIVTRLKGGDPLIFGRGGEEAEELRDAGIPFEIVPGISSSIAGPAYAGIPVTHRSHCTQLTIFTGHEDPTKEESSLDYAQIAKAPGTKVMLMGVERLPIITAAILKEGGDPELPVALVRWATTGQQRTITGTLATIAGIAQRENFQAPAVAAAANASSSPAPVPRPAVSAAVSATLVPTSSRCPRSASNPRRAKRPASSPAWSSTPTPTSGSSSPARTRSSISSTPSTRSATTPARSAAPASPRSDPAPPRS
jgi:uroporphyrinogen III methyltransferase/synthase